MIFSQPFPGYYFSARTVQHAFLAGLSVFFVLAFLKPFGIAETPANRLWLYTACYGAVTFLLVLFNCIIWPLLFPKLFAEKTWTVGRELLMMLWQIITIAFANVVTTHFLYGSDISGKMVLSFLWITLVIGIFPVTVMILLKQQMLLKKYASGAAVLEKQLQQEPVADKLEAEKTVFLQLTGDNQNEQLTIDVASLRFITSADNYIKVHFMQGDKLSVAVLRSTLKKAEAAVQDHPQVFRCHRAYLVNLAAVYHVSGNAQGYKLHVKDVAEPLPVSRSLNNELAGHIEKYAGLSRLSQ